MPQRNLQCPSAETAE